MKQFLRPALIVFFAAISSAAMAQVADDMSVTDVIIEDVQAANNAVTVDIEFQNVGSNAISSIHFNWSIDGGTTVNTMPFSGVTFPVGFSATLSHSTQVTFSNPGNYTDLMVWTSMPNGVTDANTSNDTMHVPIFVNIGTTVARRVLIEEFTTAPCGFCPDGAIVLENTLFSYPNAIGVGIHAGFGTDAMTIAEHSALASAFTNSAPSAVIDRVRFPGENRVAIGRNTWNSRTALRNGKGSPVDVTVGGSYNSANRTATITVTANFADYALPGDIRLGLYVVEDSVVGSTAGYHQTNYYHTTSGHPYQGAGNPIVGYPHRHVVRDVFPSGTPWGATGIIPNNPAAGATYTQNYTVTLDQSWNTEQISFVAFMGYYDANDVNEREIINAGDIKLSDFLITGISELSKDEESLKIYPNPTSEIANVSFNLSDSKAVNLALFDMTGKKVLEHNLGVMAKGNQFLTIDTEGLSPGFYFMNLSLGEEQISRKLSIVD